MAADLSKTLWGLEDMIEMTDSYMPTTRQARPLQKTLCHLKQEGATWSREEIRWRLA